MTIGGWILFICMALGLVGIGWVVFDDFLICENKAGKVLTVIITSALIVALWFGMHWFFNNTAMGQRALVDQKSNFNNGLERTITVYTADGEVIAQYSGLIDIATSEGGYIKFDFEGKRYIYYNCFVESVAEIE